VEVGVTPGQFRRGQKGYGTRKEETPADMAQMGNTAGDVSEIEKDGYERRKSQEV